MSAQRSAAVNIHFMTSHQLPDAAKATAESSWAPTPFEEAVAATIHDRTGPQVTDRKSTPEREIQ